jgi:hypothetical protein
MQQVERVIAVVDKMDAFGVRRDDKTKQRAPPIWDVAAVHAKDVNGGSACSQCARMARVEEYADKRPDGIIAP